VISERRLDEIGLRWYGEAGMGLDGRFWAKVEMGTEGNDAGFVMAYYVPDSGYGDCYSDKVDVRRPE